MDIEMLKYVLFSIILFLFNFVPANAQHIGSLNIISLSRIVSDFEYEYVPIGNKTTWSFRIASLPGTIDDWYARSLGGRYRRFISSTAPAGPHLGIGVNVVELVKDSGPIEFFGGPLAELGYRLFIREKLSLCLRGELYYYYTSANDDEDYPSMQGLGYIFPGKGLMTGVSLQLSFGR
jgi:hypothetical protein